VRLQVRQHRVRRQQLGAVQLADGVDLALAGGMLARWMMTGAQRAGLQDALVCGVACASLTIEAVGVRGIARATPQMLEDRMKEVWACLRQPS